MKIKTTIILSALLSFISFIQTANAGDYTKTKYPIVLVHGVTGFDTVGGLINYFHTVPYNLQRSGATVYTASVSALAHSEDRGRTLAEQIVPWALGNGGKVNIMAHSQGAPTSRVAASLRPDLIASITSINGANKGSKVADAIRGFIPSDGIVEGGVAGLANAVGEIINALSDSDHPQDALAALKTLTSIDSANLNQTHGHGISSDYCGQTNENVDVNGHNIVMFSWTGTSQLTSAIDPTDYFLKATSLIFQGEENDGLVAKCATYMGKVLKDDYWMNHIDAVNHLLGARHPFQSAVTPYRQQANRLKGYNL